MKKCNFGKSVPPLLEVKKPTRVLWKPRGASFLYKKMPLVVESDQKALRDECKWGKCAD